MTPKKEFIYYIGLSLTILFAGIIKYIFPNLPETPALLVTFAPLFVLIIILLPPKQETK